MQTVQPTRQPLTSKRERRRFGYAVAIGINVALLWIVHNVVAWDWPPFITDEWNRVSGLVELSLFATILVTVAYLSFDPPRFKGIGDAVTGLVSLSATARVLSVFPFDFADYPGPWATLVRAALILAIVGTVIGIIANLAKAVRGR